MNKSSPVSRGEFSRKGTGAGDEPGSPASVSIRTEHFLLFAEKLSHARLRLVLGASSTRAGLPAVRVRNEARRELQAVMRSELVDSRADHRILPPRTLQEIDWVQVVFAEL
jgi:hypothetical protein